MRYYIEYRISPMRADKYISHAEDAAELMEELADWAHAMKQGTIKVSKVTDYLNFKVEDGELINQ